MEIWIGQLKPFLEKLSFLFDTILTTKKYFHATSNPFHGSNIRWKILWPKILIGSYFLVFCVLKDFRYSFCPVKVTLQKITWYHASLKIYLPFLRMPANLLSRNDLTLRRDRLERAVTWSESAMLCQNWVSFLSLLPILRTQLWKVRKVFFCLLFFHPQPFGKAVSISHPKISCNKILSAFNLLFNGMKKLIKQLNFDLFLIKEICCIGAMARSGFVVLFYCRRYLKLSARNICLQITDLF